MAQKMHIILEDDIDGSEATQTVSFALDGVSYEIDLNDDHAASLRDALATWTNVARRTGGRKRSGKSTASGHGTGDNVAIRAWAQKNGIEVSARGRIAESVRSAYAASLSN